MNNVIGARGPRRVPGAAPLGPPWDRFGGSLVLQKVGIFGDPLAGLDPAHVALAHSVPAWVTGAFAIAVFAGLLDSLCMVAGKKLGSPLALLFAVGGLV